MDNGYLSLPTLIPPLKLPTSYAEMRFSKWLESMRKDVECTFGILKGRFRILKTGIPLHGVEVCDCVWKTCCALHNFLLEEDGLDECWDAMRYLGEEGHHHSDDVSYFTAGASNSPLYDTSGMGVGSDFVLANGDLSTDWEGDQDVEDALDDNNSVREVHKMSMRMFRAKLIEHFDILFQQNKIVWPTRFGNKHPDEILTHRLK